jgi:uncharacterized damage-inducible protein DinB
MTYYTAKQMADAFRTVRKNTITIAEDIPEERYAFKATPEVKSVAEMLAHIVVAPDWQLDLHGNRVSHVEFERFSSALKKAEAAEQALRTKTQILSALRDKGEALASFLESLDEQTLAETVTFPPPVQPSTKTRFEMLLGIKEHEMHHRAQLMLIQRLLGQVPHLTRQRQDRIAASTRG